MSEKTFQAPGVESSLTERQRYWLDHLRTCEASGDTIAGYAKSHEVSAHMLYQWRRDFRRRGLISEAGDAATSFAKVRVVAERGGGDEIRIYFPNGIRLEWPAVPQGDDVNQLLQAVANLS